MCSFPTLCHELLLITHQATNAPDLQLLASLTIPYLPINLGTVAAFLYATLYVLMEPVAGGLIAPFIMAGVAWGNHLTSTYGATANWAAVGVHIFSWIIQFIGHGKFEGRAPALFDNLVQALFLAPMFVWLEVLFYFGYRPELKKRLDKGVAEQIAKWKAEKQTNGATNGKVH